MSRTISIGTIPLLLLAGSAQAALLGHYELDGSGYDEISGNTAATTAITGAEDRYGNPNSAVFLNGSSSIIQPLDVGIDDASLDFSLTIWFKPNVSGLAGLISNNTPAGPTNGWSTLGRINSNDTLLFLAGAAQNSGAEKSVSSVNSVSTGEWNHAAFVYDKNGATSTMSVYLNGDFEASTSKNFTTQGNPRESWLLGAQYNLGLSPVYYLNGYLDDFRIYDTVLTAEEISAMVSPVPIPAAAWLFGTALIVLLGAGKRKARISD